MNAGSRTQTLTTILIFLNALIWFCFGIITALDLHPALPEGNTYRWMFSSLALGASLGFLVLYFFVRRGSGFAYYLLVVALVLISILTIADDFGLADLIVLVVNLGAMLLLVLNRKTYFRSND